jgi:uncharacterized coiled-coil protein SlyX
MNNEVNGIDARQRAAVMRMDERLDRFAAELSKLKTSDGASHANSLDSWLRELQGEVVRLRDEVAELRNRLRA